MQKLRASVEYAYCCVFGLISLILIYGFATLLSVLELARIIKPIYPRHQVRRSYSSQSEQQPMLFGSLVDK